MNGTQSVSVCKEKRYPSRQLSNENGEKRRMTTDEGNSGDGDEEKFHPCQLTRFGSPSSSRSSRTNQRNKGKKEAKYYISILFTSFKFVLNSSFFKHHPAPDGEVSFPRVPPYIYRRLVNANESVYKCVGVSSTDRRGREGEEGWST